MSPIVPGQLMVVVGSGGLLGDTVSVWLSPDNWDEDDLSLVEQDFVVPTEEKRNNMVKCISRLGAVWLHKDYFNPSEDMPWLSKAIV